MDDLEPEVSEMIQKAFDMSNTFFEKLFMIKDDIKHVEKDISMLIDQKIAKHR